MGVVSGQDKREVVVTVCLLYEGIKLILFEIVARFIIES